MIRFINITVKIAGLALTIVPSFFVFAGVIDLYDHYRLMLAGCILWFGSFLLARVVDSRVSNPRN